ncbi:uncharacterized protein LOC126320569 isoform X2 [Schistocerca gregaria]|uniref:uncharacterized protein LOC126320569 isoform X2 n=1 Tax=Schistocerca gregaria TaxID=7010 RepID=UPI00211EB328|nr:uncharacterized protein LOC126320569 isoform X2 [Schistocerca gregaria]
MRVLSLHTKITNFAGTGDPGLQNGPLELSKFHLPHGITVNSLGELLVADTQNHCVRLIDPSSRLVFSLRDCKPVVDNEPDNPYSIVVSSNNSLFFSDYKKKSILVLPKQEHTTHVVFGPLSSSDPFSPRGLFLFQDQFLYFCDSANHAVYVLNLNNHHLDLVSGQPNVPGFQDGPVEKAAFNFPTHLLVTPEKTIYISDTGNHAIRKISRGRVVTITGSGKPGYLDGSVHRALFNFPHGLHYNPNTHNLLVADSGNSKIRLITKEQVYTLSSEVKPPGLSAIQKSLSVCQLNFPTCFASSACGDIYLSDTLNNCIRKIELPPELWTNHQPNLHVHPPRCHLSKRASVGLEPRSPPRLQIEPVAHSPKSPAREPSCQTKNDHAKKTFKTTCQSPSVPTRPISNPTYRLCIDQPSDASPRTFGFSCKLGLGPAGHVDDFVVGELKRLLGHPDDPPALQDALDTCGEYSRIAVRLSHATMFYKLIEKSYLQHQQNTQHSNNVPDTCSDYTIQMVLTKHKWHLHAPILYIVASTCCLVAFGRFCASTLLYLFKMHPLKPEEHIECLLYALDTNTLDVVKISVRTILERRGEFAESSLSPLLPYYEGVFAHLKEEVKKPDLAPAETHNFRSTLCTSLLDDFSLLLAFNQRSKHFQLPNPPPFVDVVLAVEDAHFPCHRCILAAQCRYFEREFLDFSRECRTWTLPKPGHEGHLSAVTVKSLLTYLYTGNLLFDASQSKEVLKSARYYEWIDESASDVAQQHLPLLNHCMRASIASLGEEDLLAELKWAVEANFDAYVVELGNAVRLHPSLLQHIEAEPQLFPRWVVEDAASTLHPRPDK